MKTTRPRETLKNKERNPLYSPLFITIAVRMAVDSAYAFQSHCKLPNTNSRQGRGPCEIVEGEV